MTSLSAQSNRRSTATPATDVATGAQERARWAPAAVLLTAMALRIGLALGVLAVPDRSLTPDGVEYRDFGRSLAAGEGFVRHQTLVDGQPIAFPEVFRTPGYPLFLAAAERLWPGGSTVPAILLQVLIGSGTCLLVYAVTRRLTRRTLPALCAGLYFAVDTPSAVHSALLLSETLAAFALAAALLFGLRFIERRRLIDVVLAAAA